MEPLKTMLSSCIDALPCNSTNKTIFLPPGIAEIIPFKFYSVQTAGASRRTFQVRHRTTPKTFISRAGAPGRYAYQVLSYRTPRNNTKDFCIALAHPGRYAYQVLSQRTPRNNTKDFCIARWRTWKVRLPGPFTADATEQHQRPLYRTLAHLEGTPTKFFHIGRHETIPKTFVSHDGAPGRYAYQVLSYRTPRNNTKDFCVARWRTREGTPTRSFQSGRHETTPKTFVSHGGAPGRYAYQVLSYRTPRNNTKDFYMREGAPGRYAYQVLSQRTPRNNTKDFYMREGAPGRYAYQVLSQRTPRNNTKDFYMRKMAHLEGTPTKFFHIGRHGTIPKTFISRAGAPGRYAYQVLSHQNLCHNTNSMVSIFFFDTSRSSRLPLGCNGSCRSSSMLVSQASLNALKRTRAPFTAFSVGLNRRRT